MSKQRSNRLVGRGGFCDASLDLIEEALANGWTFRVSARGHCVLRSPDGEKTISVARKLPVQNRTGQNARAAFRRWKVEQTREE